MPTAEGIGIPVLVGNAAQPNTLKSAQLTKARTAFGDSPSPAQQAQLAELQQAQQQAQAHLESLLAVSDAARA